MKGVFENEIASFLQERNSKTSFLRCLPYEIWVLSFGYLRVEDLIVVARSSHTFRKLTMATPHL
jgi:hypothetical protein